MGFFKEIDDYISDSIDTGDNLRVLYNEDMYSRDDTRIFYVEKRIEVFRYLENEAIWWYYIIH